jgi:hypothetical protein
MRWSNAQHSSPTAEKKVVFESVLAVGARETQKPTQPASLNVQQSNRQSKQQRESTTTNEGPQPTEHNQHTNARPSLQPNNQPGHQATTDTNKTGT